MTNKVTLHRGARAIYSHSRHLPQSPWCPGESLRLRMSPLSPVWGKEGFEPDWRLHCVGIFCDVNTNIDLNLLTCVSLSTLILTRIDVLISDQTDRATSTYAQGARPKETTYSPSSSSYSSTARQSSINRHTSSSSPSSSTFHRSSLARDPSSTSTTRFLNRSSTLHSSQEKTGNHQSSSDVSSSYPSRTSWYTTPLARAEAPLPPRPAPEGGEPEGHRSTRRLLSRLFSRRSSQDSCSGSSGVRSRSDDGPTTGGESVVREEGAHTRSVEPDMPGSEAAFGVLRNHRAELSPIQENNGGGYRRGLAQSRMSAYREPGVGSNSNASNAVSSSSWLSSSLRGRCSPLLSRLRRHTRNESAGSDEGRTHPQHLPRRWDNLEHNTPQDEDDDDGDDEEEDEEEKAEGAIGVDAFGGSRPCKPEDETLPELEDASVEFSPRRRVGTTENLSVPVGPLSGAENRMDDEKKKTTSSRDQEKLRKIKERWQTSISVYYPVHANWPLYNVHICRYITIILFCTEYCAGGASQPGALLVIGTGSKNS